MAPKKKEAQGEGSSSKPVTRSETRRVTRSVTRGNSALLVRSEAPKQQQQQQQQQKKKKQKATTTKKKTEAAAASEEKAVKAPQSEEAKTEAADVGKETDQDNQAELAEGGFGSSKVIVIEHCKQCSSFKKRAAVVKEGLEDAFPGITIIINPEKPRKGCLEVREDGGQIFLSLLDMKRPFKPMKDLDMDKVISDIVSQIKG